jgi:hypothetical protein
MVKFVELDKFKLYLTKVNITKRMFEKSLSVDFTTPATEKRLRENKGFGVCDRTTELHLRLKLTLFKHPLSLLLSGCT